MYHQLQILARPFVLAFLPFANYAVGDRIKNNNFTVSPVITNNVSSIAYCFNKIETITYTLVQWLYEQKNKITPEQQKAIQVALKDFLWMQRYTLTGTTLASCYSFTCYKLITDYYYITCANRWCQWKGEYTFEQLCAIPQKQLAQELIFAIGKYINMTNPTDFTYTLVSFINVLEAEIEKISHFIKLSNHIKTMGLIKIFPTNDTKIKHAEKLLQRVHFVKHIFLSWLTEFNLHKTMSS